MAQPGPPPAKDMVWIPGGTYQMGSNDHYPEEAPVRSVSVDGFWIDSRPVTNAQFRRFVKATGYVTVAEHRPDPALYPGAPPDALVPGSSVFVPPMQRVDMRNAYNWWAFIAGADWRHPDGPDSTLNGRDRHPVVHVAYEDVIAYAAWAGKELPTEAEWEFAARGGLDGAEYAWGDTFTVRGRQMANTWQGNFPYENEMLDGFARTSPVGSFPPNGYGLWDMIGNVWEWTTDWYTANHPVVASCCSPAPPRSPAELDPENPHPELPRRVLKGGSHLCAPNYCQRYRPAARMPQAIDTGTSHLGFRCIVRA